MSRGAAALCLAALLILGLAHGCHIRGEALQCAIQSERTDMAIARCYLERGLPCPDDICPR